MRAYRTVLLAGLLLFATTLVPAAGAAPLGTVRDGLIDVSARDEDFAVIVEALARATGETYLFDDSLSGRMTIAVGHLVDADEALAILDAALLMRGFAVLEAGGGVRKILAIGDGGAGAPYREEEPTEGSAPTRPPSERQGSSFLTTLIRLEVASAELVAAKLQHLVARERAVLAYPPTNSLILVGTDAELRRLIELARALDAGVADELLVRTLRHRAADVVAELAGETLTTAMGEEPIQLWSDIRTNSILAVGTPEQLARARFLLRQLDVPLDAASPIGVVRVLHRDAEDLAEIIRGLAAAPTELGSLAGGQVLAGRSFALVAEPGTNSLVVDADAQTFLVLRGVIEELDRIQPQILVEIVAYEISNPTSLALGIDWFLPAFSDPRGSKIVTATSIPSGGGLRAQASEDLTFFGRVSRDPLLIPFLGDGGIPIDVVIPRETMVITADARDIKTKVLMRPRLVMSPGEAHELFAGDNIPIPVAAADSPVALAGTQTRLQIERRDVGMVLRVEPSIGQAGKVSLKLDIEISRVGAPIAGPVELVGPTLEKREVTTKVSLANGEVAVIGTSQQKITQESLTTTPFLGDIPFLGRLMESRRERTEDVHLVFSVQARLLKTPVEMVAESIRQRLASQRAFSRVRDLNPTPGAPYAMLLDTLPTARQAEALRSRMEAGGYAAQVGRWKDRSTDFYDVYLTGYADLMTVGDVSRALHDIGFRPQVVVLPAAPTLAGAPQLFQSATSYPLGP